MKKPLFFEISCSRVLAFKAILKQMSVLKVARVGLHFDQLNLARKRYHQGANRNPKL